MSGRDGLFAKPDRSVRGQMVNAEQRLGVCVKQIQYLKTDSETERTKHMYIRSWMFSRTHVLWSFSFECSEDGSNQTQSMCTVCDVITFLHLYLFWYAFHVKLKYSILKSVIQQQNSEVLHYGFRVGVLHFTPKSFTPCPFILYPYPLPFTSVISDIVHIQSITYVLPSGKNLFLGVLPLDKKYCFCKTVCSCHKICSSIHIPHRLLCSKL